MRACMMYVYARVEGWMYMSGGLPRASTGCEKTTCGCMHVRACVMYVYARMGGWMQCASRHARMLASLCVHVDMRRYVCTRIWPLQID